MKKFLKYITFLAVGTMSLAACQADFEKINTNFRHLKEEDLQLDGLKVGGFLTSFQQNIFPVGTTGTGYVNDYQIPYTLAGACWIGYMSPAQNKWVGTGFPSYALKNWSDYTFNIMHKKAFGNYIELKQRTEGDPAAFAVINIIKIATVHKATDTFGPIPYSQEPEKGAILAVYDSQENVYRSMLKELDEAVKALREQNHDVLPNYDMIYGGSYQKWAKFANSLMLRLAMRVVYADQNLAKEYAEKAVKNEFGVIESISDIAQLSRGAGITLNNPLVTINGSYNDVRMGAEIYSYMKGYDDPRLETYFLKGKQKDGEDFYPVFKSLEKVGYYLEREKFSLLNVANETPIYIMKASEVAFLRAEGALRGWNMGGKKAEEYYKEGVSLSFKENGIADSKLEGYLNGTGKPMKFVDAANSANNLDPVSTVTVKWEGQDFEKSLEKIITQKYIALYPDGQEAWSEYRRTGYPRIFAAKFVRTDSDVDGKKGPTRIPYSNKEYTDNLENIKKAVEMLGGPDNGATRLWWDKNPNK
ncbi:hypothetical protein IX307_000343 [Bacteroides pyogenes]|uniref:SusD/RagB family nutrient-binding outer membrane lipoprotein n=1 Tax=Bacteroides pyogenes TaxID=310300 RepID=UPI001BA87C25|nr:SusD/RagB family nutrient-binding outer membrane lipoprotein [Bacteroides pyogenes]MBR8719165.1 hypothetical protein [Bacteroides pyogenes]MBR8786042.1 hypothetical protein [Bacteroides pyogenes]MBR8791524.1 hypothetical protein [Bacteroides pyogenes]